MNTERSGVNIRYHPQQLFTPWGTQQSPGLTGQQAPGILLSPPPLPSNVIRPALGLQVWQLHPTFYENMNSGPHTCLVGAYPQSRLSSPNSTFLMEKLAHICKLASPVFSPPSVHFQFVMAMVHVMLCCVLLPGAMIHTDDSYPRCLPSPHTQQVPKHR